jgi:predicted nucleic acid-binding protein
MSKVFFDTNILVYAFDEKDKRKRTLCRSLLRRVSERELQGVLSTQVLQEFCVVGVKKLGMDPLFAKGVLASLERFEIVTVSPPLINEAIDCQVLFQLSFWDALVLAAAASARCETIWTEDFNPGQVMRGAKIENPLKIG